jgi:hypothetical protein
MNDDGGGILLGSARDCVCLRRLDRAEEESANSSRGWASGAEQRKTRRGKGEREEEDERGVAKLTVEQIGATVARSRRGRRRRRRRGRRTRERSLGEEQQNRTTGTNANERTIKRRTITEHCYRAEPITRRFSETASRLRARDRADSNSSQRAMIRNHQAKLPFAPPRGTSCWAGPVGVSSLVFLFLFYFYFPFLKFEQFNILKFVHSPIFIKLRIWTKFWFWFFLNLLRIFEFERF